MKIRTFYFLKTALLLCAVPFVSATDAHSLLLVAALCGIGAALFHYCEA